MSDFNIGRQPEKFWVYVWEISGTA